MGGFQWRDARPRPESLLEAADAEAGRLVFHPEEVDAADAVADVVAMLEGQARAHDVRVVVDVDPRLGALWLDRLRLRQVLLSYIGNAIKFSHRGGTVDVRLRLQGPDRFRIEAEDRGIGIAPGDLATLFERFHPPSRGTTKTHEGAGFGLALVRMLVAQQGGTVDVHSELGAGSVFGATWPMAAKPA